MFESMKPYIFVGRNDTARNRRALQRTARRRIVALIREGNETLARQIGGVAWAESLALQNVQRRAYKGRQIQANRFHVEYHGGDQTVADECGGACVNDK